MHVRVALYARVSTADKDPRTQLLPLRDFCAADPTWTAAGEWVDHAPATDLRGCTAWRELLALGSRRKFDLLLVRRIDRAFRSILDAAQTLERLRAWGVGLRSYQEPWLDTTTPFGEALYYITVAYALSGLERALIAERVRAGMQRARPEGKHLGRPPATARPDVRRRWPEVAAALEDGSLSVREGWPGPSGSAWVRCAGCAHSRRRTARRSTVPKGGWPATPRQALCAAGSSLPRPARGWPPPCSGRHPPDPGADPVGGALDPARGTRQLTVLPRRCGRGLARFPDTQHGR